MGSLSVLASGAMSDICKVFNRAENLNLNPMGNMLEEIMRAKNSKIVLYGVGREGLMLKALAMRLFHLGLNASCVGDMTAPNTGHGDLFITSAGPGSFSTVEALMEVASKAGARVLLLTAQPGGSATRRADTVAVLPARTMADGDDMGGENCVLPMGSVYEGALFVLFEIVVMELSTKLGQSVESMRARHTNLE